MNNQVTAVRNLTRLPYQVQIPHHIVAKALEFIDSQIHRFTDLQIHRFTDSQIHKFADSQIRRFTDSQIHRFTDSQIPHHIEIKSSFKTSWSDSVWRRRNM